MNAEQIIKGLLPEDDQRKLVLSVCAESVVHAHEKGPRSWGITCDPKFLTLNVGKPYVFHIKRAEAGSVFLCVSAKQIPDRAKLSPLVKWSSEQFASVPDGTSIQIPTGQLSRVWSLVRDAHFDFIDQAIKTGTRTPRYIHHSKETVEYMKRLLGRDIPQPDYAGDKVEAETKSPKEQTVKNDLDDELKLVLRSKNVIQYGPPGTGKTWSALHKVRQLLLAVNVGQAEAARYSAALAQNDKDELKKLASLLEGAGEKEGTQYWWVTANPTEWAWNQLFQKKAEEFRRGRIQHNYDEIEEGDLVFGYTASPKKEVTAIARVKKLVQKAEGPTFVLEPVQWIDTPVGWAELKDHSALKLSEPIRQRARGTLFKLDDGEAAELVRLLESKGNKLNINVKTSPRFLEFVTFHQSYSYEDFVEGLRPKVDEESEDAVRYEIKAGVFRRLCRRAQLDPDHTYALMIDEINRGNISKIFGELITLIEPDKRLGAATEIKVTLPYSGEEFVVPPNVLIIGTMNTADRSIALLDVALRRRFTFIEVVAQPKLLTEASSATGVPLDKLLTVLNRKLEAHLDRDHQIGHSYFMEAKNAADLKFAWDYKIVPLLQEYFYGDGVKLLDVLGKDFVVEDKIPIADGETTDNRIVYRLRVQMGDNEFIESLKRLAGS